MSQCGHVRTNVADNAVVQVERQRVALAAVDTEAEEESGITRELAAVMCTRLDAARRATEKLLGVLQVGANLLVIAKSLFSFPPCRGPPFSL